MKKDRKRKDNLSKLITNKIWQNLKTEIIEHVKPEDSTPPKIIHEYHTIDKPDKEYKDSMN